MTRPVIDLRTFSMTGNVGPIGAGTSQQEVMAAFGPPCRVDPLAPGQKRSLSWNYGLVQIAFASRHLVESARISLDEATVSARSHEGVAVVMHGIVPGMDRAKCESWLTREKLAFEPRTDAAGTQWLFLASEVGWRFGGAGADRLDALVRWWRAH